MSETMARAVIYDEFGGVEKLRLAEMPVPPPGRGEVQVSPAAVSVNPIDGKIRRGELTLMSGRHFPKRTGQDFAGRITALGPGVGRWTVGQQVYGCCSGMRDGALADLVNVSADAIAAYPAELPATVAASVPMVAQAALQSLTDVAQVRAGTSVLINGCTGGFGLYALQIARHLGAWVTGVCAAEAAQVAVSYGAGNVIDFRTQDVAAGPERYDVILELSGKLPFERVSRVLSEHGVYVDVSPSPASLVASTVANPVRHHKHKFLLMKSRTEQLDTISAWLADGTLKPAPVTVFGLDKFAEAYRLAESGSVIGKLVIELRADETGGSGDEA
jgi:NADPH:quinone reductase-like Zn-dependent oxidoreductase